MMALSPIYVRHCGKIHDLNHWIIYVSYSDNFFTIIESVMSNYYEACRKCPRYFQINTSIEGVCTDRRDTTWQISRYHYICTSTEGVGTDRFDTTWQISIYHYTCTSIEGVGTDRFDTNWKTPSSIPMRDLDKVPAIFQICTSREGIWTNKS